MEKYIIESKFLPVLTDTDSYYFALSEDRLEDAVKPEMIEEYERERFGHCGEENYQGLMIRECCENCKKHDNTTPVYINTNSSEM